MRPAWLICTLHADLAACGSRKCHWRGSFRAFPNHVERMQSGQLEGRGGGPGQWYRALRARGPVATPEAIWKWARSWTLICWIGELWQGSRSGGLIQMASDGSSARRGGVLVGGGG